MAFASTFEPFELEEEGGLPEENPAEAKRLLKRLKQENEILKAQIEELKKALTENCQRFSETMETQAKLLAELNDHKNYYLRLVTDARRVLAEVAPNAYRDHLEAMASAFP